MRERSIARKPSSYDRNEFAASVRKGSATGVKIRARNSFTRSDSARDFFFRLFGLDQLLEHERLRRRRDWGLRLRRIERCAERERRLRDRCDEWRLARRHDRGLVLARARLALFRVAELSVQH